MNALTFMTRACPRRCDYCDASKVKIPRQMDALEWVRAFQILKDMGVEFNLILGNEPWVMGEELIYVFKHNKVPYGLYTTAPPDLFNRYAGVLFLNGIDNLSCGLDYIPGTPVSDAIRNSDEWKKSMDAWKALLWTRKWFPNVDTQGNITINKTNLRYLYTIAKDISEQGIYVGVNFIQWNIDGLYDFFPKKEVMGDFLITPDLYPVLQNQIDMVLADKGMLLQLPWFFNPGWEELVEMKWHCKGDPYGGPTIEADGSLRVCGYRKGERTSKFSIFDLAFPHKIIEWRNAVRMDAAECPGCAGAYPWMYQYLKNHEDPEFAKRVFRDHANRNQTPDQWSKRTTK
jgi:MoaA/NifB/PqqE/SkfB family radical SAM enzyme